MPAEQMQLLPSAAVPSPPQLLPCTLVPQELEFDMPDLINCQKTSSQFFSSPPAGALVFAGA